MKNYITIYSKNMNFETFKLEYEKSPLMQNIAKLLSRNDRCFMCRTDMNMIDKQENPPTNLLDIFNATFLVHLKTTHGIDPDMLGMILKHE